MASYIKKCPKCSTMYGNWLTEADWSESVCLGQSIIVCQNCHHVFFDFDQREWIFLTFEQQIDYLVQVNMKKCNLNIRLYNRKKRIRHLIYLIVFFAAIVLTIWGIFYSISYFIWFSRYNKSYKTIKKSNKTVQELDRFGEIKESLMATSDLEYVDLIKSNSDLVENNSPLNNINSVVKLK